MTGGTSEAQSRPDMASSMTFIKSTCSCFELAVRGVWGCLTYSLGFGEDYTAYDCKKDESEEVEEEIKTRKREEGEEEEDETKSKKKEAEHKEEYDRTGTRKREEDEAKTKANGEREINLGVMIKRGPKKPGIHKGGGGQVN